MVDHLSAAPIASQEHLSATLPDPPKKAHQVFEITLWRGCNQEGRILEISRERRAHGVGPDRSIINRQPYQRPPQCCL